jgi:SAM-dependent methyltransferase
MGWDDWHAGISVSTACDRIVTEALGLPPGFPSNSLLPWAGIADLCLVLGLAPGSLVVDVACGRGGYGREIARRAGARLVGLDISSVAIAIAWSSAGSSAGSSGGAGRFVVGDYTAAGLRDGCAQGVVCVDAMQFAEPPVAGLAECRRLLAPGGRIAVTAWEALDPGDERLPERTRRMNLARDLAAAGFGEISVTEKPQWLDAERALWEAAVGWPDDGTDPGLASLRDEAGRVLAAFDGKRRVLATGVAYQSSD